MFDISPKNNITRYRVWLPWLDKSTDQLHFPNALHPLADALKGFDVFDKIVWLRRLEVKGDQLLLTACDGAFEVITLKILVRNLKYYKNHKIINFKKWYLRLEEL